MRKYLKYIVWLCVIILTPLILDWFVFNNDYQSRVTNDGWAGFLGGYIGAILGAATTIIAVNMQIKYNEKIRKEDAESNIKPYLYFKVTSKSSTENEKVSIGGTLTNVGLQAACDVYIYDNERCDNCLLSNHLVIPSNQSETIDVLFDFNISEIYLFVFYDVKGNRYEQKIKAVCSNKFGHKFAESFISLEPIKTDA